MSVEVYYQLLTTFSLARVTSATLVQGHLTPVCGRVVLLVDECSVEPHWTFYAVQTALYLQKWMIADSLSVMVASSTLFLGLGYAEMTMASEEVGHKP